RWINALQQDIMEARVPINATVVERKISLREVAKLKPGDVIPVEMPESVTLKANGVPVFRAKLGSSNEHLALKIIERVKQRTIGSVGKETEWLITNAPKTIRCLSKILTVTKTRWRMRGLRPCRSRPARVQVCMTNGLRLWRKLKRPNNRRVLQVEACNRTASKQLPWKALKKGRIRNSVHRRIWMSFWIFRSPSPWKWGIPRLRSATCCS